MGMLRKTNLLSPGPVQVLSAPLALSPSGPPANPGGARMSGPFVLAPFRGQPAPATAPAPSFADYFSLIYRRRLSILAFVLFCVLAAYFLSRSLTPTYEAVLTIDVDRQPTQRLMGPDWNPGSPNDVDQFIATQVRLIQSDPVLRPVVRQFGLLGPEYVSRRAEAAPIELRDLKVSRPASTYLIQIAFRDHDPERAAQVANAVANSYVNTLDRTRANSWRNVSSFTSQRLAELKANMEQSGVALQTLERELGMVDPDDKSNIVALRLQQINLDYARAGADRATREAAYEAVRSGNADSLSASPQGEPLRKLMERHNEALQKFSEIKAVYGDGYPEYRRASAQLSEIDAELDAARRSVVQRVQAEWKEAQLREGKLGVEFANAKAESDKLMNGGLPYRMLKQKADADRALYDEFVRKLGEAEINVGVQKSGVRVAEMARAPLLPVSPNVPVNCAAAGIASLLFACIGVVFGDAARSRLRKVEEVKALSAAEVLGTLPMVRAWRKAPLASVVFSQRRLSSGRSSQDGLQAAFYEEAIRMFRGSLLTEADARGVRTLLIASPRGREGRSTTAAHLAMACADLGLKTVLVDGDLRKPALGALFPGESHQRGLGEVLRGEARWQDVAVRHISKPLLHLIPAGRTASNVSELMSTVLPGILEEAARQCDLVILDSPPLLEHAQAVEMARAVDAVLLVVRANESDPASVQAALEYLRRLRSDVLGIVVNGV